MTPSSPPAVEAWLEAQARRLPDAARGYFVAGSAAELAGRLTAAVRNEQRAGELACRSIADVPDPDLRMALAQQGWQEFHHQQRLGEHLDRLGVDWRQCPPLPEQEAFYAAAAAETDWLARLCFTHLVGEALLARVNRATIELAARLGDEATRRLYLREIEPEEAFHREIGRLAIRRHGRGVEAAATAAQAVERALVAARRLVRARRRALLAREALLPAPPEGGAPQGSTQESK